MFGARSGTLRDSYSMCILIHMYIMNTLCIVIYMYTVFIEILLDKTFRRFGQGVKLVKVLAGISLHIVYTIVVNGLHLE